MSPHSPEELFPLRKMMISQIERFLITVSTIRERDKKNGKYYVGDYYIQVRLSIFNIYKSCLKICMVERPNCVTSTAYLTPKKERGAKLFSLSTH